MLHAGLWQAAAYRASNGRAAGCWSSLRTHRRGLAARRRPYSAVLSTGGTGGRCRGDPVRWSAGPSLKIKVSVLKEMPHAVAADRGAALRQARPTAPGRSPRRRRRWMPSSAPSTKSPAAPPGLPGSWKVRRHFVLRRLVDGPGRQAPYGRWVSVFHRIHAALQSTQPPD